MWGQIKRILDKEKIPFNTAVILLVAGFFIGTVFTVGSPYWNKMVKREECKIIQTTFVEYSETGVRGEALVIHCSNGEKYDVDDISVSSDVLESVQKIQEGENLVLLIHPNSNTIVEFNANGKVLFEFDKTIDLLVREGKLFSGLGLFMYLCGLLGLYYTVQELKIRRYMRQQKNNK